MPDYLRYKCLLIRQPWAGAIIIGLKSIETRTWATTYRGALAIHASKSPDHSCAAERVREMTDSPLVGITGAVLGIGILDDCRPMLTCEEEAALCCCYSDLYAWVFRPGGVYALRQPRPTPGQLGLFEVDLEVPIEFGDIILEQEALLHV